MQRLGGMDASFVYGETPSWHVHVGAMVVPDPSSTPDRFDVHRLRVLLEAWAGLLWPFLRRLVAAPFGLDRPAWVNDPHLDLDRHIRRVGSPPPCRSLAGAPG